MTASQQRDALAEAFPDCIRWSDVVNRWQYYDGERWVSCKDNDPLRDFNAAYAVEKSLTPEQRDRYNNQLIDYHERDVTNVISATALERAQFLLRARGKWKD